MTMNIVPSIRRQCFAIAAALLFLAGCQTDDSIKVGPETFDAGVANVWMGLATDLTKNTPGFSPPVAARAYAYCGVALYESVAQGSADYRSLQGQIQGLEFGDIPRIERNREYHWGQVANSAMRSVFSHLYRRAPAGHLAKIDSLEDVFSALATAEASAEVFERSKEFGEQLGEAIIAYSKSDGQDSCFKTNFPHYYIVPQGPGLWVPTPPAFQPIPLQPYWGLVRTFSPSSLHASQPVPHFTYSEDSTSAFYAEALEVYETVNDLDSAQLIIAKYWSDDPGLTATPPGHSISIALQVLELENASLVLAAETFARVGMGVHDAFVSCWKCKYDYNLMRPVTYIRAFMDAGFTCPLNTPPFPEYTSGHSVQSGAMAEILTSIFGDNYAFTDRTHEARTDINGSPRSFSSFYDAADEAAISRLYGGIHYRAAIDLGVQQGKRVGESINSIVMRK